MTRADQLIVNYLKRNLDARDSVVARLFGVEHQHVNTLRRRHGLLDARKAAARMRGVKSADLDQAILAAVYRRGLVDVVLSDGK